jgi:hypothetical protein
MSITEKHSTQRHGGAKQETRKRAEGPVAPFRKYPLRKAGRQEKNKPLELLSDITLRNPGNQEKKAIGVLLRNISKESRKKARPIRFFSEIL